MAEQLIIGTAGAVTVDGFELATIAEGGMPLTTVGQLKAWGITAAEVAELVIPDRTLQHRRAKGQNLSPEETDRAIRLARIAERAVSVFGSREKALMWLRTPDGRMQGRTPMSLIRTESGGRLVENMLGQIDEGMFA